MDQQQAVGLSKSIEVDRQSLHLGSFQAKVEGRLRAWDEQSFSRSLWAKDYRVWSPQPVPEITNRLGWLTLPEGMRKHAPDFIEFARQAREDGMRHVVLLGMGGSSLAPEVFARTFGHAEGYPELIVLDSTHPGAVLATEAKVALARTLFVVSSKSGTTLETLSLFRYFWKRSSETGAAAGPHFVAITDAGTPLETLARERGFRRCFSPPAGIRGG